jgi:hypothetical protein
MVSWHHEQTAEAPGRCAYLKISQRPITYHRNDQSRYSKGEINEKRRATSLVEALLLTLEVTEAATVGAEATTAATTTVTSTTAATSTTVAKATTASSTAAATTSAEAAATATSATATTESTTATVVGAGSSVVNADGTTLNILAVQSLEGSSSLLSCGEVDVSEALERAGVAVGGERDTGDAAVLGEDLLDRVVGAVERQVAEEEGVGRSTALVAVLGGAVVLCGLLTGSAEVDVQIAAIKLRLVHLFLGGGSLSSSGELDVSETLGATGLAVGDDTAAGDVTEPLELAAEPVLIDVPAQAANEQVLDALGDGSLDLCLLDDGLGSLLGLALLGRSLLLARGVRVRVVGVGCL